MPRLRSFLPQNTLKQLRTINRKSQIRPENSWLLRLSVQTLVSIGILATDVAAGTQNSLWAIPLSFVGATWSGFNRNSKNWVAKAGIAIGMLVVLGLFLGRIVGQANDTRIVLAELLIQLQVLHTFDLPRRKDLGYSATIGLILIAVAATISETTIFGAFLLLFLALALPVLILDYRSRLNLQPSKLTFRGGTVRQFSFLLAGITVLGLSVFALMPRLPGYQLRTFPVSAPIDVQGTFDNQKIVNPGYVQRGEQSNQQGEKTGQGATFDQASADKVLDSTFYYGFNQEINQTLRGNLKPQEVMRVRAQAPGFWRVMAFDEYTGSGWKVSENDKTQTLKRPSWSYRFLVANPGTKAETKEIVQTFSILADFPNLIPALSSARHIYFPTQEIAVDKEGGLRSPVGLEEGLTYTVVSDVPIRNRTELKSAPTKYPKAIAEKYLQLPEAIAPKIKQSTEALLAKSEYQPTEPSEQALVLAQLLKQRYSIQPDLPPLAEGQDLVDAFLNDFEGGYADHFSSALTVMLRSIGIPARLATGFAPGQFNPFTGMYVVKNTDAFGLTEVYVPKYGWIAYDPIPGHPLVPPSVEDLDRFPLLTKVWHWIAGWFPSPVKNLFSQVWLSLSLLIGGLFGLITQGWYGFGVLLIVLSAIAFMVWVLRQGQKYWRYRTWRKQLDPMEQLYQDLLLWLKQKGYEKPKAMTPIECLRDIQTTRPDLSDPLLDTLIQAYVQWKYGQKAQNYPYLQQQFQAMKKQSRFPAVSSMGT